MAERRHQQGEQGGIALCPGGGKEYFAAGVRGPITGRRADLIVIDDPVKSWAEAESQIARDALYDWYRGELTARLKPGGRIVLIMCMVGQTRVLMADGTEKRLKDIRPGDKIATYNNRFLDHSVVENWKSQGEDFVFEIQTESGATTKANARHPFLVERNGTRTWIRLKDIKAGDALVRVSTTDRQTLSTARGRALPALATDATSPQSAKATACPTTIRSVGQVATDRPQTTR